MRNIYTINNLLIIVFLYSFQSCTTKHDDLLSKVASPFNNLLEYVKGEDQKSKEPEKDKGGIKVKKASKNTDFEDIEKFLKKDSDLKNNLKKKTKKSENLQSQLRDEKHSLKNLKSEDDKLPVKDPKPNEYLSDDENYEYLDDPIETSKNNNDKNKQKYSDKGSITKDQNYEMSVNEYTEENNVSEKDHIDNGELVNPVEGTILNKFGDLVNGQKLYGINILANKKQKVRSADSGKIVYVGTDSEFGNIVIVKYRAISIAYAKLGKIYVKKDTEVKKGQEIADTGNSKILYVAVQSSDNKTSVNPENYLKYNDE